MSCVYVCVPDLKREKAFFFFLSPSHVRAHRVSDGSRETSKARIDRLLKQPGASALVLKPRICFDLRPKGGKKRGKK